MTWIILLYDFIHSLTEPMNDLLTVVKNCDLNLYADDVVMHCSSVDLSCAEHELQDDLNLCILGSA